MKRRGLLLGLSALVAAPAIVKAESLMKLAVPKKELLVASRDLYQPVIGDIYFDISGHKVYIYKDDVWQQYTKMDINKNHTPPEVSACSFRVVNDIRTINGLKVALAS